jgi:hypothetical protein
LPDHTPPLSITAPSRGVFCCVPDNNLKTNANAVPVPARITVLLPNPKLWWQRRPKAFRHPNARQQYLSLAIPAFLLMVAVQSFWIYQLTKPVVPLPIVLLPHPDEDEPAEFEIDLDPGPTGPSAPNSAPEAPSTQANAQPSEAPPQPQLPAPSPANSVPVAKPVAQNTPQTRSEVTPVLRASASLPAPQPVLSVDVVPSLTATEQPLLLSEDAAAESTTELPAEQAGAVGGTLADADPRTAAVRPLAIEAQEAPEQIAAAPIVLMPGISAPKVDIVAADPVPFERPKLTQAEPSLDIERNKPAIAAVSAPVSAVDPVLPLRVKPEVVKPELAVQIDQPSAPKPTLPIAAARPVLQAQSSAPEPAVDANVTQIERIKPSFAPVKIDAPTLAEDASAKPGPAPPATASSAANAARDATASTSASASSSNANRPARDGNSALPSDPFASTPGSGGRDLFGQAAAAAASQVGEKTGASGNSNAFRRYHDPFAEDYPSRLSGLRMREPQLFSDVSKYLVKTFGSAALGFAIKPSDEFQDFSGPDMGVLIEQWIQAHHSDLKQECKRNQETMDEHVRALLCGS